MEDVALSLKASENGNLVNVRTARIFHDSQPGTEKSNMRVQSEMDLVNRYYIMKYILNRSGSSNIFKLVLQQLFGAITSHKIFAKNYWMGKYNGIKKIRRFK